MAGRSGSAAHTISTFGLRSAMETTTLLSALVFTSVPGFLPGLLLSIILGYIARRRVAEWLNVSPVIGWAFVVALGLVLAATLTPLHESHPGPTSLIVGCDMSRIGFAPLHELRELGDTSLNVLLLMPLGAVIGYIPASPRKIGLMIGAVALPFIIETTQLVVTPLDRACQSADVVDNITGLVIGFGLGLAAALLVRRARRAADATSTAAPD